MNIETKGKDEKIMHHKKASENNALSTCKEEPAAPKRVISVLMQRIAGLSLLTMKSPLY